MKGGFKWGYGTMPSFKEFMGCRGMLEGLLFARGTANILGGLKGDLLPGLGFLCPEYVKMLASASFILANYAG